MQRRVGVSLSDLAEAFALRHVYTDYMAYTVWFTESCSRGGGGGGGVPLIGKSSEQITDKAPPTAQSALFSF